MVESLTFPPSFLFAGVGVPALSIYPFNLVVFCLLAGYVYYWFERHLLLYRLLR